MVTVGFYDNEDTISGSTRAGNYCNVWISIVH